MSLLQFGNEPKKFIFVHQTTSRYFCVRLTDNIKCNLAVELAMASTVGIEDSPIEMKEMCIEIVLEGLLVPLNLMFSWQSNWSVTHY